MQILHIGIESDIHYLEKWKKDMRIEFCHLLLCDVFSSMISFPRLDVVLIDIQELSINKEWVRLAQMTEGKRWLLYDSKNRESDIVEIEIKTILEPF